MKLHLGGCFQILEETVNKNNGEKNNNKMMVATVKN